MKSSYSASDLYSKAWATLKKHIKQLGIITIIGVIVSVVIQVITTIVIVNNIQDIVNDTDGFAGSIVAALVSVAVSVLASVFITLLQVVALKSATEGKSIELGNVMNESMKYLPRAISYGAFVVAVVMAGGIATGFIGAAAGPLGLLLGLALIVGLVIAAFRYAFVQFLIVEPKEMPFMERFKVSERLTNGIYGSIFVVWLIGFLIAIVGGIAGGILSSPFQSKSTANDLSTSINFNSVEDTDDFISAVNKAADESKKIDVDVNYVLAALIVGVANGFVSFLILGAFLELYKQRKAELKM